MAPPRHPDRRPARATLTELTQVCELSATALRGHIRKAAIKADGSGRYNVKEVLAAIVRHRMEDNQLRGDGTASRIKQAKAALEIQILQHKLGVLKGEVVPIAEVRADFSEYASIVNSCLAEMLAQVALRNDAGLLEAAREAADGCRKRLASSVLAAAQPQEAPDAP